MVDLASPVDWLLVIAGQVLITVGVFCDLVASISMIRFPNFYTRLHAATVGSIGGAFVPIIGVALVAAGSEFLGVYRWFLCGASLVIAFVELLLAGAGSHALARATHRAKAAPVMPVIVDQLEEDRSRGEV
ncbi:MAG: monovalent cation/H(+) antiporter subunit G [Zestosphaera sp.]